MSDHADVPAPAPTTRDVVGEGGSGMHPVTATMAPGDGGDRRKALTELVRLAALAPAIAVLAPAIAVLADPALARAY